MNMLLNNNLETFVDEFFPQTKHSFPYSLKHIYPRKF
jgi:hypothetical protein